MSDNLNSKAGKLFPQKYLEDLGTDLFQATLSILREQRFTDTADVANALDLAVVLLQYAHWKETNTLKELFYTEMPMQVAQAVNYLYRFDGANPRS